LTPLLVQSLEKLLYMSGVIAGLTTLWLLGSKLHVLATLKVLP
jgi:hypothetical protein